MSNHWQEAYTDLEDFIDDHSEIVITKGIVSIPEDVRPEFYRLFNTIRVSFIKEKFPTLLRKAATLSKKYLKVEGEVKKLLALDEVSMVVGLQRFLHSPMDESIRGLFNPLFDLLKKKVDIEAFDEGALKNIKAFFTLFYRLGYEKWVVLSLVQLLEADRAFQITRRELGAREGVTPSEENAPTPKESKHLIFKSEPNAVVFTVPDFIVRSGKSNQYFAIRSELSRALVTATNANTKREWLPLESIASLESGLTLIYIADEPDEISLVADAQKICRPDLVIECGEQEKWYKTEGIKNLKLNHTSLKPKLGTYIVTGGSIPEQVYKELMAEQVSAELPLKEDLNRDNEQEAGIHILGVGFDQLKLEPIITALINPKSKD